MNTPLRPCGHRLAEKHFVKIRKKAREWKLEDAAALRKIVDEA